jgi:hypothetical protein
LPMKSLPSVLCRVLHSAKPLPSVKWPLPSVLDTLGKERDSGSATSTSPDKTASSLTASYRKPD